MERRAAVRNVLPREYVELIRSVSYTVASPFLSSHEDSDSSSSMGMGDEERGRLVRDDIGVSVLDASSSEHNV